MKHAMRVIQSHVKEEAKNREYRKDENGRITVPLIVKDDSDFLSVFSENEIPIISSDIADYIESKTNAIDPDEPLSLKVFSNCIDEEEQEAYRKGVKEYYLGEYITTQKELRRNTILAFVLLITGLIALYVMNLIDAYWGSSYWTEVVDIVAWVFVWESVDTFVFGTYELRTMRKRCLTYIDMIIDFLPLKSKVNN